MKNNIRRIVMVSFIALAGFLACNTPRNSVPPEQSARAFAQDLGFSVKGASCTGADTDNDGYVSCTVSLQGDTARTMSLQCAALNDPTGCTPGVGTAYAVGCKETMPKVVQPRSSNE